MKTFICLFLRAMAIWDQKRAVNLSRDVCSLDFISSDGGVAETEQMKTDKCRMIFIGD